MSAANIIDTLFVALGFEIETEKLDEFKDKVLEGRNAVLGLGAAMAAAAAGILAFTLEQAEAVDHLGDWSEQNNVAIETVQELGHAAQIEGSNLDAMKASIEGLNRVTGEAINGVGRGAKMFQKFGISARDANGNVKTFDTLLLEVSDKMQGMSRQAQRAMLLKLGIDPSLVVLLAKGRDRIRELMEEAKAFGETSQEDADKAGELMDAYDRMKFITLGLSRAIATQFMPRMTAVLVGMRRWVMLNKEWIKNSIFRQTKLIVDIAGLLFRILWDVVGVFTSAVKWLLEFKAVTYLAAGALAYFASVLAYEAIVSAASLFAGIAKKVWGLVTAINAANASALLVPALIGAIVVAFALLSQDLWGYFHGQDSLTGRWEKEFPHAVEGVIGVLGLLGAALVALKWNAIASFASMIASAASAATVWVADMLWMASAVWYELIPSLWGAATAGVTAFGEIAVAVLAATWPILAIIAAAAALGLAAYELWEHWDEVLGWLKKKFEAILPFINTVVDAVKTAGKYLGFSGSDVNVNSTSSSSPSNTGMIASRGVLGRAGTTSNTTATVDQSQTTHIGQLIVQSPDPAKAGKAVRDELAARNKKVIRNGQTGVVF